MKDYPNVEFHRQGYGMLANLKEKDSGSPVCFPMSEKSTILTGYCNCARYRKKGSCSHLSALIGLARKIQEKDGRSAGETFAGSHWYRLGEILGESNALLCAGVQVKQTQSGSDSFYEFSSQSGSFLAKFPIPSSASTRFWERVGGAPKQGSAGRAALLKKLESFLSTDKENAMNNVFGNLTRRQAAEQSFWGRLAYHAWREYGDDARFHAAVEPTRGDVLLRCFNGEGVSVFEIALPRSSVRKALAFLSAEFTLQTNLTIHPTPVKSVFCMTRKTESDIEVRPAIKLVLETGETKIVNLYALNKFRYGDLIFIPEMNLTAALEYTDSVRRSSGIAPVNLKKSQVPYYLDKHRQELADGLLVPDESMSSLSLRRDFDRMEVALDKLNRSWYWLSVHYGFGDESISLTDVIQARKEGKSYLETRNGWIDVHCDAFRALDGIEAQKNVKSGGTKERNIKLSAVQFLRLTAFFEKSVRITGDNERVKILKRLTTLEPAAPWEEVEGFVSKLRSYQIKGVDWLKFLFENRFGGLLCDDMGLGKTHQAMALMVWMREKRKLKNPILVVCPTTVISHWANKIRDFAPGLSAAVYHGGDRKIENVTGKVLLTSYGVLRNDIATLRDIPFSLTVFDEIQNLKNRDTLSYKAATLLQTEMRVGMTGTPIENSIQELKSLFDLVLPGYLGSDAGYASEYSPDTANPESSAGLAKLKRLISPFTLRRRKADVLEELPEKIEDTRTCVLSEIQIRLYREAIAAKGTGLLMQLSSSAEPLPYIHIFALLNLLKRICDHPALALNQLENYQEYNSGKWELFQELLFEALDNGQKIVVFTQYLGMIAIMERMLAELDVPFVVLTGASLNRGEIIRRFNEDNDCRVFLGSLKAGGVGIDLTGGSTVIHYDRWWNAAREDQATDRVYRIGQKRAVQVFKLVTEGTLEEKISAIIDRKRNLMNAVIQTDNPQLSKIYTREELADLLQSV